jgi:Icc-related predicted phosphoesterase
MIPVGSTAVREAILKYQPMLGLHGHIHESSGIKKLGDTTLVNPGSEYAEGILRGALIEVNPQEGLVNVNLVTG